MTTEEKEKIACFIVENKLQFSPGTRNLDATILSGFVLSLKITSPRGITKLIKNNCKAPYDFSREFERVFEYAEKHEYGAWWKTPAAKKQYKF